MERGPCPAQLGWTCPSPGTGLYFLVALSKATVPLPPVASSVGLTTVHPSYLEFLSH